MLNYLKHTKNKLKAIILLSNFIVLFFLFISITSVKILSTNFYIGVVYSKEIINLFPEIKEKLFKLDQKIYEKEKELYNLPRSLELEFLSKLENYSEELLRQQKNIEKETESKILSFQTLNTQIKEKIENYKKETEAKISIIKKDAEKKLYEIEKEIYHLLNKEMQNLKNKYQNKIDLEIQKEIYNSKEEIQKYKEQISELYKNEIVNLNLKISNSSIYDNIREESLKKLQDIKQK
ncbi:MAG: hypothetical protein ACK4GR_05755, partial [bacterium]